MHEESFDDICTKLSKWEIIPFPEPNKPPRHKGKVNGWGPTGPGPLVLLRTHAGVTVSTHQLFETFEKCWNLLKTVLSVISVLFVISLVSELCVLSVLSIFSVI